MKFHLLKKSLTKLKKLKISSKKQIPWKGGYFNVSTPDKVAEAKIINQIKPCLLRFDRSMEPVNGNIL